MSEPATRWGAYVGQRLADLESGTGDFTGLRRPTAATVRHAREVVAEVLRADTPTPSVVPTEDGDVAFVWHKNGHDAEITASEDAAEFWARDRATGEVAAGPLTDKDGLAWMLNGIADKRPASMLQPVTFDDDGDSARRVPMRPVDEAEDIW